MSVKSQAVTRSSLVEAVCGRVTSETIIDMVQAGYIKDKNRLITFSDKLVTRIETPLMTACRLGNKEVVKHLIQVGVNVNIGTHYMAMVS